MVIFMPQSPKRGTQNKTDVNKKFFYIEVTLKNKQLQFDHKKKLLNRH